MSWYEQFLVAGTVVPLIGFAFLVFFGHRLGKPLSGWFTVLVMGTSCVLATCVLFSWHGLSPADRAELTAAAVSNQFYWADMGSVPIKIGVKLDSLTVIMFFMVTFIATWIFVFSVGYMAGHSDEIDGQSKYHRFFTYLCMFAFSMLGLVISSNLLFLFIFWELVGLCSYLLIGFYFDKKFASNAAMKAFITNRVGDFGFLFGLMMVFFFLGTLDLDQAAANFRQQYASSTGLFAIGYSIDLFGWQVSGMTLATLMGVGLFCGAMGKSAQFPLHVWLPDAMAGPTPVSALIHAATMVAAGVYLVARIFRLLTPDAQMVVAVIGCITLTMTALIAIVQTDIKKVLAYSTLSQLGYMIFGLGVGAWTAALFHLMTHAFFKAMMFLGSGQVIEGCHHEQEITKMGGLHKKMPVTCWTFFIGVLAIAGTGIPWTGPGIGGFYSKDEILAAALMRTDHWPPEAEHHAKAAPSDEELESGLSYRLASDSPEHGATDTSAGHDSQPKSEQAHGPSELDHAAAHHVDQAALVARATDSEHPTSPLPKWLFWFPIAIAYVTPFYMMRLWWLTFMGKPRDQHVYDHAHESKLMYVPLVALAVGTFFCSYWVFRPLLADAASAATDATMVVAIDGHAHDADHAVGLMLHHDVHRDLVPIVGFAFLIGFGVAWAIYRNGLELATRISSMPGIAFMHRALRERLYIDQVYDFVLVMGCRGFSRLCSVFDAWVVDMVALLCAALVRRIAAFSGWVLDARGVDGVVNGVASLTKYAGNAVRQPQTGRVRNYVLFAAGSAAVVLLLILAGSGAWSAVVGWIGL